MTDTTSASGGGADGGGGAGGRAVPGNCNGSEIEWALQIGSAGVELGQALASDGQGGVFLTGSFSSALELGRDDLQANGMLDNFLTRIDENGNHVWSRSFGDSANQLSWLLAAAPDGELLVAGGFNGTIDFGDGMVTGDVSDAFIARYDALGNFLWKKIYAGAAHQSVRSLVVDPESGDILIGGLFHDTVDIGGGVWTSAGSADAFIARLDGDGEYIWGRQMFGAAADYTFGIAIDGSGRVLAGGSADGDIDLGEGVRATFGDGQSDPWAGLYDAATGDPIWTRVWPDNGYQVIRRAAFTTYGAHVVGGRFYDNLELDGTTATFGAGVFVAELTSSGVSTDVAIIGNAVDITAMHALSNGGLILSGYWWNSLSSDPVPIPTAGGEDGMVIELDADLDLVSTLVIGSTGYDDVSSVVVSGPNVYASATFRELVTLPGCDAMTPVGDADAVLLKLAP
jgi:hypothetical protein